jgi:hypothetical protein
VYLYVIHEFDRYAAPVCRHRGSGKTAFPMRQEKERAKPAPFLSISAVPIRLYPQAKPLCREFA